MGEGKRRRLGQDAQVWLLRPTFRELQTVRDLATAVQVKTEDEMDRNDRVLAALDAVEGISDLTIASHPVFVAGLPADALSDGELELARAWSGREALVRPAGLDEEERAAWARVFQARMDSDEPLRLPLTLENVEGLLFAIRTLAAAGSITGIVSERIGPVRRALRAAKNGEEVEGLVERAVIRGDGPRPVGEA